MYEKAIYAALSGDIKHVSVCLDHDMLPQFCITLHPSSWYIYPVPLCEHSCCQLVSRGLTMCGHTSESWWTSSLNRFLPPSLPPSLFPCCDQICAVTYCHHLPRQKLRGCPCNSGQQLEELPADYWSAVYVDV